MKYLFTIIFFAALIFTGCSKKEESRLVAFSPEAFAYDLGDSWEVNATINVKGFNQKKNNNNYEASLNINADLILPSGEKIKNVFTDSVKESQSEEFMDLPIEAQFDLDSTYSTGKYGLIIHIKDNFSDKTTDGSVSFNLTE